MTRLPAIAAVVAAVHLAAVPRGWADVALVALAISAGWAEWRADTARWDAASIVAWERRDAALRGEL
jgi:hypothetical protein